MNKRLVTKYILWATAAVWLVWESVTYFSVEEGDMFSEVMWDANYRYPILGLFFAALWGHWFWQRRKRKKEQVKDSEG